MKNLSKKYKKIYGKKEKKILAKNILPKDYNKPYNTLVETRLGKTLFNQENKFDGNKLRFSLIPIKCLTKITEVLEFGANKYSANSWKRVRPYKRYYDAALRHLYAWFNGEKKDPDSGLSHLAHAACCIIFLLWFDRSK